MKKKVFLVVIFLSIFLFFGIRYTGFFVGEFGAEVDPGIVVVDYEFRDGTSSSDFLRMTDADLANVDNLALEVNGHGKVYFPGTVDLTIDEEDGYIYLDQNVDMFHNFIFVNSTELKSLNRSAIISFKDINLKNPVVARNGVLCPETQCAPVSFVDKEFIFEVDSFSYYTLIEDPNPDTNEDDSGGSSGGGSSGDDISVTIPDESFFVAPDFIGVRAFPGELKEKSLMILNNGSRDAMIEISMSSSLKRFLKLKNSTFILGADEAFEYPLHFAVRDDVSPGVYSGNLIVKTGKLIRSVDVLIEARDPKRLFDMEVKVDEKLSPGEPVFAKISVYDLGAGEGRNVKLYYSIRDFDNNVIVMREETVNVGKRALFDRELRFPRMVSGERYIFYAQIEYDDKIAFATDTFKIREAVGVSVTYIVISALVLALIIWIAVRVLWDRRFQNSQPLRVEHKMPLR